MEERGVPVDHSLQHDIQLSAVPDRFYHPYFREKGMPWNAQTRRRSYFDLARTKLARDERETYFRRAHKFLLDM